MKRYNIKATSWVLWITTGFTPMIVGALLMHEFIPKNDIIAIPILICLVVLGFYIQRFISRAEVQISVTDSNVSIKWLKQFIFHKRPDREISLTEIESYKYQEDKNFDLFKLTLKDGTEYKFWHSTFSSGDDFNKLVKEFPNIVSRQNKKSVSREFADQVMIKREKTIFESSIAPFLAVFAGLLIIVFIIISIKNPSGRLGSIGAIGGASFSSSSTLSIEGKIISDC